jgi:hypothetical protein
VHGSPTNSVETPEALNVNIATMMARTNRRTNVIVALGRATLIQRPDARALPISIAISNSAHLSVVFKVQASARDFS